MCIRINRKAPTKHNNPPLEHNKFLCLYMGQLRCTKTSFKTYSTAHLTLSLYLGIWVQGLSSYEFESKLYCLHRSGSNQYHTHSCACDHICTLHLPLMTPSLQQAWDAHQNTVAWVGCGTEFLLNEHGADNKKPLLHSAQLLLTHSNCNGASFLQLNDKRVSNSVPVLQYS